MNDYSTRDSYDTYIYYLALKKHFTSTYDFFKYNGKVKSSASAFETRKDKFFFYKLSKRKDNKEFILANVVHNPNVWIGDLVGNEQAENVYKDWTRRQQSITYLFKNDLLELNEDFNSNLVVKNGQHPDLLRLYIMGKIHLETLVIIDDLLNVFSYWEKKVVDTIIFPGINNLVKNVKPFLKYDREKMRAILLNEFQTKQVA